jgi:hypothetical protein
VIKRKVTVDRKERREFLVSAVGQGADVIAGFYT